MRGLFRYTIVWVALGSSAVSAQDEGPKACRCFTATSYVTNNGCPAFEPKPPCTTKACVAISISTVPGTNSRCTNTPTVTSFLPCETACPTGCGSTYTTTTTLSASCLPTTKTTTTPTAKPTTKPTIKPTKPPKPSTVTLTPPTITTPPTSTRPCWTKTISVSNKCPEDDIQPCYTDCLYLSETTVPGGPVKGCPITPTVTQSRICKGTCDWGCGTHWVTKTATDWKA